MLGPTMLKFFIIYNTICFFFKIAIYSINYFNIESNLFLSNGPFELYLNLSK